MNQYLYIGGGIFVFVLLASFVGIIPGVLTGHPGGHMQATGMSSSSITFSVTDSSFGSLNNGLSWGDGREFHMRLATSEISTTDIVCGYWNGVWQSQTNDCAYLVNTDISLLNDHLQSNQMSMNCGGYPIPVTFVRADLNGFVFSTPAIQTTGMPPSVFDSNPTCTIGGTVIFERSSPSTYCGDLSCDPGENYDNCPQDCGYIGPELCGNGICGIGETPENCDLDCGSGFCGDHTCQSDESYISCEIDCPPPGEIDIFKSIQDWFNWLIQTIRSIIGL